MSVSRPTHREVEACCRKLRQRGETETEPGARSAAGWPRVLPSRAPGFRGYDFRARSPTPPSPGAVRRPARPGEEQDWEAGRRGRRLRARPRRRPRGGGVAASFSFAKWSRQAEGEKSGKLGRQVTSTGPPAQGSSGGLGSHTPSTGVLRLEEGEGRGASSKVMAAETPRAARARASREGPQGLPRFGPLPLFPPTTGERSVTLLEPRCSHLRGHGRMRREV